MFCYNCGNEIPDSAKFCPKCGAKLKDEVDKRNIDNGFNSQNRNEFKQSFKGRDIYRYEKRELKNPWIALILSLLIVGLGQIYNGEVKKGLEMLVAAILSGLLSLGTFWFVVAIYSAIDAWISANKINNSN